MSGRWIDALRKSFAVLAMVGVCVWGRGCNPQADKPGKPAANGAGKPAEQKPAEDKTGDEAGSSTGAGGGTQTP